MSKRTILSGIKNHFKQRWPWYIMGVSIILMTFFIGQHNTEVSPDKFVDLTVATLSIMIGVIPSAFLILWERRIDIADNKKEKLREFNSLFPTLFLETRVNLLEINELKTFLDSYDAVWSRAIAITDQFLSSGYKTIRDAKLLDQLGGLTESASISYARLAQVQGIAKEGKAICQYDREIKASDRAEGDEQLELLATITDICWKEMDGLYRLILKEYPEIAKRKNLGQPVIK